MMSSMGPIECLSIRCCAKFYLPSVFEVPHIYILPLPVCPVYVFSQSGQFNWYMLLFVYFSFFSICIHGLSNFAVVLSV
jgi:hypothetical protein